MMSTHSRSRALRSVLARPAGAGDVLVAGLAGAQRRPEPAGIHRAQGADGLGDDRRVVALAGRVDDAERQRGGLQRGAEPRPGEPGVALPLAPRREVVRGHRGVEAGLLGALHRGQQGAGMDLLVRGMETKGGHARPVPGSPDFEAKAVMRRSGVLQMPERELRAFSKVHVEAGGSERVELPIARPDLEHFHPEAGWVFAGGSMQVSVGSSSRDIRLQATIDIPGHPVEVPVTVWSRLGDWMANPVAGPALRKLIEERGGIKGRIGDLLSDPVSQDSALMFPLISVTQFPGFPVSAEEAQELSNRL